MKNLDLVNLTKTYAAVYKLVHGETIYIRVLPKGWIEKHVHGGFEHVVNASELLEELSCLVHFIPTKELETA